jgi:histidinol-phosphatase (PHP family)
MQWTNYHQHSQYDDGTGSIEAHVAAAIRQGVVCLGFSGHAPLPFENCWSMNESALKQYLDNVEKARQKHSGQIQLYKSLEFDFIPEVVTPHDSYIKELKLDYTVGSVHFVGTDDKGRPTEIDGPHQKFLGVIDHTFRGDVKALVKEYFHLTRKMVQEACPDVVGHLDKIKMQNRGFWDEKAIWYQNELLSTLEEIRASGAIVEVNTRGIYKKLTSEPYPGGWILKHIHDMNIPIQINSDAHHPREITKCFPETAQLLLSIGFRQVHILKDNTWQKADLRADGLLIN